MRSKIRVGLAVNMNSSAKQNLNTQGSSYFHQWSGDALAILREATILGSKALTVNGEMIILSNAINQVLRLTPKRDQRYFNTTLLQVSANSDHQSLYSVKLLIDQALLDLLFLDQMGRDQDSSLGYASRVLKLAQAWCLSSIIGKSEMMVLERGLSHAMEFLSGNDFNNPPPGNVAVAPSTYQPAVFSSFSHQRVSAPMIFNQVA